MPDIESKEMDIEQAVHLRTIDVPCCGNCKWFERVYSDTECVHPGNCEPFHDDIFGEDCFIRKIFPSEHQVCDRFEREEKNYGR